jgi:hypothetical protein
VEPRFRPPIQAGSSTLPSPKPGSAYLDFLGFFAVSDTVVFGFRLAVDGLTYLPVIADRCCFPVAMGITVLSLFGKFQWCDLWSLYCDYG